MTDTWHSHGDNVGHEHRRGDERHFHTGRRAEDGGLDWVTEWEDGTTETSHVPSGGQYE